MTTDANKTPYVIRVRKARAGPPRIPYDVIKTGFRKVPHDICNGKTR